MARIADPSRPGSVTGEIGALKAVIRELLAFVNDVVFYADRRILVETAKTIREKYKDVKL